MDKQLDIIPFEFSGIFIDSFGAKIMAEVFRNEQENERKQEKADGLDGCIFGIVNKLEVEVISFTSPDFSFCST